MGFILSKFKRKKPTTKDLLENIDKELRDIQRFQVDTELRQKRIIGRIVIFSAGAYLLAAAAFYFLAPSGLKWQEQLKNISPFIVFPPLMWCMKYSVAWYYEHKIVKKKERYIELKKEKERILEDVIDNETFKVGKEILEKYAPTQLMPKHLAEQYSAMASSMSPLNQTPRLPQRSMPSIMPSSTPGFPRGTPTTSRASYAGGEGLRRRQIPPSSSAMTPVRPQQQAYRTGPPPSYMLPLAPSNPVVHDRSSGWMDKLVEYFIGDGPNNRYALICRYCATNNGLATTEDFPYVGFRCVYCHQYNPPKQVRPTAPKLPSNTVIIEELESSMKSIESPSQNVSTVSEDDEGGKTVEQTKGVATEPESDPESESRPKETEQPEQSEAESTEGRPKETTESDENEETPVPAENAAEGEKENTHNDHNGSNND